MNLIKRNGISLVKGSSISLEKKGRAISQVKVGINWGSIKNQFFGITFNTTAVDLDSSVALFSKKQLVDNVYYHKLLAMIKPLYIRAMIEKVTETEMMVLTMKPSTSIFERSIRQLIR